MSFLDNLRGTLSEIYRIGREGLSSVQWKNDSGAFEARNDDDTAYVNVRGLDPVAAQDLITKTWAEANFGSSADLATVQVRRSTDFTVPTPGFGDIIFDVGPDVQNDTTVLEQDAANPERIDIKETGLYVIAYSASINADPGEETFQMQVIRNGVATELAGSLREITEDDEINDISCVFWVELDAGDYITFQVSGSGAGNVLIPESTYGIMRARGAQGPAGPAGAPGTTSKQLIRPFDANDAIYPITSPAAGTSRNNHPLIAFDQSIDENIEWQGQISKDYTGADIEVTIDWLGDGVTTGDVKWDVAFERLAPGGQDWDSDGFAAAKPATDTTAGTDGVSTRSTILFTQAEAGGVTAEDMLRLRVTRDTTVGGNMAADAQLASVNIVEA